MAKPDDQTGNTNRDRTKGESAFADSKTESSGQAVTQDKSAEKTRVDAAKTSETDSDWNFSSGSTGMAKETKFGLALCVLLIGAFSFVVYSKMNKQKSTDDDFVASTDSTGEEPPSSSDDGDLGSFGNEPKDGDAHDHGDAFNTDRKAAIDNFDVPQRRQQVRRQQQRAEPWQSSQAQTTDDHSQDRHAAVGDDPFSQASHRQTHEDDTQARQAATEPDFGFEDDPDHDHAPTEKTPEKRDWNHADFADGNERDERRTATEQHVGFEEPDDESFGLEPDEHDHNGADQVAQQPTEKFSPFARTEQAETTVRQRLQRRASPTFADEPRHDHGHDGGLEGEAEFDAFGSSETPGAENMRQSTRSSGGRTTQVQRAGAFQDELGQDESGQDEFGKDEVSQDEFDAFDAFDEPSRTSQRPRESDDFGMDNFGSATRTPAADSNAHRDPFGSANTRGQQPRDDFSQPFSGAQDQSQADRSREESDQLLPDSRGSQPGTETVDIYVAKRGDNFWDISKRVYRAGRYYKALASYNRHRISDPKKLRPGMKVLIPKTDVLESRYPSQCPWKKAKTAGGTRSQQPTGYFVDTEGNPLYCVGTEDTLGGIARNHLGRASRWVQVFALNRDRIRDPAKLKIGTILRLPADASQVQLVPPSRSRR